MQEKINLVKEHKLFFIIASFSVIYIAIFLVLYVTTNFWGLNAIDKIYIEHSGFGLAVEEYKIDFTEKSFWEFHTNFNECEIRDSDAQNEGFVFVSELSSSKIKNFMAISSLHGLHLWRKHYNNYWISDGAQWALTIYYKDGRVKEVMGSNKYPLSWGQIGRDFEQLTGENLLR